ncbi:outer membrane protein assembly factor BamA [Hahella sp. HN01]|uniref:outer membrane protein assembly factor BamA n=1 Tax=Hahella sp. HN01 TaxID=2847262 RepID=UPI001C1EC1B3|nr:outer membrane protein assembly factor BamA [Hahella sp. HN01]MBU6949927.1 outer membrane protein assembly factor BamA [Hahella sp. HN01]
MRVLLFIFVWLTAAFSYAADDQFDISDIRVDGLQRVSAGSVFTAFPVNVGESVDSKKLADATRSLFKTGLFTDIKLSREGDVLIINVTERPSISKIEVEGNKNLPTEDLMEGLKSAKLSEGEVFQRSTLERIELEILRSYVAQGRYNASVKAEVEELPRNRVQLNIKIKEGPVSAIQHINFVGNNAFSDDELRDLMQLKLTGFWASIFSSDKYSKQKLNGDLERIRSHYLDNGYIKFSIESTQVSVSPDKEQVFITVNVNEGPQYKIRDIALKGDLKVEEEELRKLIVVKPGDTFSRQLLTVTSDIISKRLGNDGYTFASVNAIPEPHDDNTASVTFYVEPGRRTYVRRVNFSGNTSTSDEVLRQEMVQMESAAASTDLIEASKSRLERLGFFKTVTVETPLVPGTNDQIDVNYSVEEQPTGSLSASLGYSQDGGATVGASVAEKNFLGTGRRVSFGVNKSKSVQSANFSYTNPYYTVDGVSRGFSLFYKETDYDDDDNDVAAYLKDSMGGSVNFGYPIDRFSRLTFSSGYTHTRIKLPKYPVQEISDFTNEFGSSYSFFDLSAGWSRSTLNKGLFPTSGNSQSFSVKVTLPELSDYNFYKLNYNNTQYFPLSEDQEWALKLRADLGYGDGYGDNDRLPFFEHYYAGGFGSIRGFKANTLGPRSTPHPSNPDRDQDPFGGNVQVESSLELIVPFIFVKDRSQIRSVVFLDGGNVFDTARGYDPSFDELRFSAGVAMTWVTPIGPLSFSLGRALNDKEGDKTQFFQFLLGQTF